MQNDNNTIALSLAQLNKNNTQCKGDFPSNHACSEKLYEMLVETIPHGIQENDVNGIITFCNSAHHKICGYAQGELVGKAIWDLLASEKEKKQLREYLTYLVNEQPTPTPYKAQNRQRNGRIIDVQVDWTYKRDQKERIVGFISIITDITERNRLEEQQRFHSEILQNIAEGVFLVRAKDRNIVFTNPKFESMFGYEPGEMLGKHVSIVNAPTDKTPEETANDIFRDLNNKGGWSGEVCNIKKDGVLFWSQASVSAFEHQRYGSVWLCVHEDITKKKQVDEEREKADKKYRDLFENSKDAILIIENETFVDCNQATVDMLGYSDKKELLQTHPSALSPEKQPDGRNSNEKANEMMRVALEKGSNRFEWDHVRANGGVFPVEVLLTPISTETGTQTIHTVWRDITEQKQQRERILHQAHYDNLTDLPNRFLSLDRLTQLIKETKRTNNRIAALFLDLDNFKKVNDTLGHDCGDQLLVQAARRLRDALRDGDTVGRLGGDEFIILLGGLTNAIDAIPVANNLLKRFRVPFLLGNRELILTASLGIACYPDDGKTSSELLRKADTAMYHSKEQGRNNYHYFTDVMNQEGSRRLQLEEHLHGALTRNEYHLCYQPIISIPENSIVGAEVLLRWNNPTLGNVSPIELIPVAEQTGHIVQIGQYVLTNALKMAAQWQQNYDPNFKISVNFSPCQFRDPNLLQYIEYVLKQSGVSGESLELEITEGVLLSAHTDVENALSALHNLGIGIAMDDFGTGYSSMSYLRRYPFDTLKIDRSFICDLTENPADRELVNASIAMAKGLGLKVVAEGVETKAQLTHLVEHGCEFAQGYLFSKPIPEKEFSKLLRNGILV